MRVCHNLWAGFDRPEPGVVRGSGPGHGLGRAGRVARPGRRPCAGPGVGRFEPGREGRRPGRGDGRRRGHHRRHGPAAPRRDGPGADRRSGTLDVGHVPAVVHVRPRPPARRRGLQGAGEPGRACPLLVGADQVAFVDIDDTIKATYGHKKQGAGYGYSKVKGLNALLAIVSTPVSAPVIAAPLAEFVGPRRSRVAAITGADTGVETIASNAFRPLTLEYP